uniref:Thyroid hormone receptor interactor 11 n=1 Tax=Scleropages formosus TaxID=113540 RepID=A0A8C9VP00_SCLFO
MSSWFGGLGSGFGQSLGQVGGSLSTFTGQISNFTKDMLLEGAEEVGGECWMDGCRSRRPICAELEEKLEAAEIQIKQQSAEYRSLIQQKEVEISHLKARQSGLQEEVQKLQRSTKASLEPAVLPVSTASSYLPQISVPHEGFQSDEMDFGDVIWSQQEINRLSSEVSRLKAEVSHWRELSQTAKTPGTSNNDQGDILKLQKTIKELRETMSREMDEHQHELAALQDAQRQKMAEVTRRHREELAEYEERIEELEEQIQSCEKHVFSCMEVVPEASLQMVAELKAQLEEREKSLVASQLDCDTISAELEELDRQNQEATQHLISLKDQMLAERKEADASAARLQSELDVLQRKNDMLQEELQAQHVKLSQSAFALNDMHMRRQQLEEIVKQLQGKLNQAQGRCSDTQKELTEFKKQLQEKEHELSAVRQELTQARERGSQVEGQQRVLEEKQKVVDIQRELTELRNSNEMTVSENFEIRMENQKLKERLEDLGKQIHEEQTALSEVVLEKDTCISALKLEKCELESELNQAEKRLTEQAQQYQRTIEELTRARSMDASALQTEHERAVKLNREKDFEIAKLMRDIEQMKADHQHTNEMLSTTVLGQQQLTELLKEKDSFVEILKAKVAEIQQELDKSVGMVKEGDALRLMVEEKDKQLGVMKEENSHLKEEIDRLRDQQSRPQVQAEPRTLELITELETEITQLKMTRDALEEELSTLRRTTEEQRGSLLQSQQSLQAHQNELEQAQLRHEQSVLNYEKLIHAKDEEITRMQEVLDSLSEQRTPDSLSPQGLTPTVVIMQEDKTQSINAENGNEKHDLSKVEIEKLVKGIKEKETEISLLNEKNLSLTKQLDQLVVSQGEVGKLSQIVLQKDLEIQALHARVSAVGHSQQQLQNYAVEREQLLAVLNEKTRENSQLRSDYHRLMDIVAGKEAALLKLQQENQRLSTMGDPSGSQEMFRETIQNLSRIIREKDIEIDALTQKCQTLVTVLQVSGGDSGNGGGGGGVSSNQFEELLQERDTLKQQVKKMEEWKQQVITTVKNMQHESAQLQEELIKLQGQISADSDCSSKLSVDYARLIQSYEQKERKLGSLSQELAQVQQTISQLSSTKDVLLEKLVAQGPETVSSVKASVSSSEMKQSSHQSTDTRPNDGQLSRLQQELEQLRRLLSERDATIRTLQENNHRLSNSLALTSGNEQAEEVRHLRDKLETMQKSLKEKDLLIKAKGDQLNHANENLWNRENDNEVLKQAVTNLKERTLILELDIRKLKEENEQVAARSREKETEFRALQETNMQVSLLLKEKEFESSTMREKAAAMEKMLKDREQGNSGELNQLLNEVRSMQEKAVAFQQERDQVILALKQKQMETSALQNELQHMRDKEQRLQLELERLRGHLLEVEDSYTREALAAEDREAELRRKVALLDEKLVTSSSAVESASQQASLQVESLQEQLSGMVKQRDEALTQLRISQEQVNQYAVSLSNLQMVLEQFQQEEKALYSAELEKHIKAKAEWKKKAEMFEDKASNLQISLDEANAALDSASRLTDQLDQKEEQIEDLKKQGDESCHMMVWFMSLLSFIELSHGNLVLMQNLFMGYFHTPKNKRHEVLRLMGSVLGLDRDSVEKLLEEEGRRGVTGWMSSWLGGRAVQSVPTTPQRPGVTQPFNTSFSELFVKFLEVESRPALPAPKLPVYDIMPLSAPPPGRTASEGNLFLAPRSAAVPLLNPSAPGVGGGGSHLLMKPISDALPTFTPVPVSAEASAGAVLKDLLK